MEIWTIGHSNHSLEPFVELLIQHEIGMLADIRRFPGSKKFPHFNRESLSSTLNARGIYYCWLEGLGGRRAKGSPEPSSANEGLRNQSFRNYADYMATPPFLEALTELVEIADQQRTAMMCSESVFWRCHRRLVSDYVVAGGGTVRHIFPNGQVKQHTLTDGAVIGDDAHPLIHYPGTPTLFD